MRSIVLLALVVALLGTTAAAQPYGDGYFVTGQKCIHYVSPSGAVTSMAWGTWNISAAVMDLDNRTMLVPDYNNKAIMKVDPKTLAVVGTFWSGMGGNPRHVHDMTFDCNGDLFYCTSLGNRGVYSLKYGTLAQSTIFMNTVSSSPMYWISQLLIDFDSGDLILNDDYYARIDALYQMKRDGSSYTTLGTGLDFRTGSAQHIPTGDIYSGTGPSGGPAKSILKVPYGGGPATTFLAHGVLTEAQAPIADRASAATQQLITGCKLVASSGSDGLWKVDLNTSQATKLATITTGHTLRVVPVFGRNLQTVKTGTGKWDVRLSFPGEGNKTFLMAVGVSGVRPQFKLSDGRNLPILMDTVSIMSITMGLAPFVTGNVGVLNSAGEAVAKIDMTALGKAVNGLPLTLCAIVLDNNAPLGISLIADPVILGIEGL